MSGPEADVEHAVGLVENDEANAAQHQRAAADQVDHAAGRADDDLRPAAKMLDLLADRLAAVDRHDAHVAAEGQFDALVADLDGQFAGGQQHQGLHAGVLRARFEAFENGDAEGGGLARARLRLAHQIDALEGLGDQPGLDRRGFEVFGLVQRGEHDLREPHVGEGGRRGCRRGCRFRRSGPFLSRWRWRCRLNIGGRRRCRFYGCGGLLLLPAMARSFRRSFFHPQVRLAMPSLPLFAKQHDRRATPPCAALRRERRCRPGVAARLPPEHRTAAALPIPARRTAFPPAMGRWFHWLLFVCQGCRRRFL